MFRKNLIQLYFTLFFVCLFCFDVRAQDLACAKGSNQTALIIMDMQSFFIKRNGYDQVPENKEKLSKLLSEQVSAIKKAIENEISIIFIEYQCVVCGGTVEALKKSVEGYSKVKFIKKTTDGVFDNANNNRNELIDYLNKNYIGNLIIAGANGGACVRHTITGALLNNCSVIAFTHGIADFNYKDFFYPYLNKYSNLQPTCESCQFKEVNSVDKLQDYMKKTTESLPIKKTKPNTGTHQ